MFNSKIKYKYYFANTRLAENVLNFKTAFLYAIENVIYHVVVL